jgi:hypothetical protein
MPSSLSADGNTLLIGPADAKLAFDLRTRATIPIGKELRSGIPGPYAFIGDDKIVGVVPSKDFKDSGVFSFPDGKRLQSLPFGLDDLESVSGGNFVLSKSLKDYAIGLADASVGKFVAASKTPSMDVWNQWMINENADGSVLLRKVGDDATPHQAAALPLSPLGPNLRLAVSPDGRLLALSARTRSGVWDLSTGKLLVLAHQFNSAVFAADNSLYAELPKVDKKDRGITRVSFAPVTSTPLPYKEDDNTRLISGMLQEWKPSGKSGVELIVHSVTDNSVLWRRTFDSGEPAHAPNVNPGMLLLSFPFKTSFAKARLKADAALAEHAANIKNKDSGRVIQALDAATGNVLHELVLEVPAAYTGVEGINIVGDQLYLTSDDNRTMVYDMATGSQLRQFFGYLAAANPASGRVCIVNRRDEALVYDAQGQQLVDFRMGSPLRFARFQSEGSSANSVPGSRLTLLTADQKIRTMEVPGQ